MPRISPGPKQVAAAAYWVARARITDPEEYKKYTDRVPAILKQYGGKVLARGGASRILEGSDFHHRFVVIEFPSMERALACHASPEYQAAASFRRAGGGDVDIVIVEGDPRSRNVT
jgi:uncharacterized protein (DUF1330 family)